MSDIIEIFNSFITQYRSLDIAEAEFKKQMHEDPELKAEYKQWCESNGSSERNGFMDYCEEYLESENDVWNTLHDFDDY